VKSHEEKNQESLLNKNTKRTSTVKVKTIMPTIHTIPTMKLANLLMRVESKIADKTKRKEETSVRMAVTPDLRKKRKARFSKTSTRATPS